jgi:hypothetical protein
MIELKQGGHAAEASVAAIPGASSPALTAGNSSYGGLYDGDNAPQLTP